MPKSETTSTSETATKVSKAFVVYINAAGTVSNFPAIDSTIVRTEFSNGVKRDLDITSMPEAMRSCATAQGFAIRTQRSYQAEKDIDKVIENYDETVADLSAGVWIESKAGEPKVTQLASAIVLSLEASGQTVDDTRKRSIIEKLKDAGYRERATANEHVQVHLAQLKRDAADKRLKEAKAAAKATTADVATSLSDF